MFRSDYEHIRLQGKHEERSSGEAPPGHYHKCLGRRGSRGSRRPRTHHARRAATWPRRGPASAAPQPRGAGAAPSFLSAGAAPPSAVRLAGPAAPHGPRRPPRSPLPRSCPGSHGRRERRKELRLGRQTGDWARPRGAIAAKLERPELPPLTPAGIPTRAWAGPIPRATPPGQSARAQSADPAPQEHVNFEVPLQFSNRRD